MPDLAKNMNTETGILIFIIFLMFILYAIYSNEQNKSSVAKAVRNILSIDLRSLALFRVCLGLLLLLDLIFRGFDLVDFYTDSGVLPRALGLRFLNLGEISFHMMSGTKEVQAILFLINGIFIIQLLLGYKTRLATILCYIFFISLDYRNYYQAFDGGDSLVRVTLFWSMFLPLGSYYSIDSALNNSDTETPKQIFSTGTCAFYAQFLFLLWFSVVHKMKDPFWANYTVLYYQLHVLPYVSEFGQHLLKTPKEKLELCTKAIVQYEIWGPVLLLSPIKTEAIRIFAIAGFLLMFIMFGLSFTLGIFPFICVITVLPFIPSCFWKKILPIFKTPQRLNFRIYYDGECGFCKKMVLILKSLLLIPETKVMPAQDDPSVKKDMEEKNTWVVIDSTDTRYFKFDAFIKLIQVSHVFSIFSFLLRLSPIYESGNFIYNKVANNRKLASRLTSFLSYRPIWINLTETENIIILFFIIYVFNWNLGGVDSKYRLPDNLRWIGGTTGLVQTWNMAISTTSHWYVFPGKLADGSEVDLFYDDERKLSWKMPKTPSGTFKSRLWQDFINIQFTRFADMPTLSNLANYYCRKWNSTHTGNRQLEKVSFYAMRVETLPDYRLSEPKKILKWKQYCNHKETSAEDKIMEIEEDFSEDKRFAINELWKAGDEYTAKSRVEDADKLYMRSIELDRELYGPNNPSLVKALEHLHSLYNYQNRFDKAKEIKKYLDEMKAAGNK